MNYCREAVRRVRPKADLVKSEWGSVQVRDGGTLLSQWVAHGDRAWAIAYGFLVENGEIKCAD